MNEAILDNNKVLDSYKPDQEIVSRKYTQISEIKPETFRGYLGELINKYAPGETIKNSPSMREKYPDVVGKELAGRFYLEVPPQTSSVPDWAIRAARSLGIIIRDSEGRIYG
ncbi:MAG TPA: hypothetical protein VM677_27845 [Actinokineospora sp.]|nr:hypothetical protein [Actinokineospora sp.]